jgi:hypothetical protein
MALAVMELPTSRGANSGPKKSLDFQDPFPFIPMTLVMDLPASKELFLVL